MRTRATVPLTPEQQKLVADNLRLVTWYLKRFAPKLYGERRESAADALVLGLCRAAQEYDPSRASFTTFATWKMFGALRDDMRKALRIRQAPSTVPLSCVGAQTLAVPPVPPDESVELYRYCEAVCGTRNWTIFRLRRLEGLDAHEVKARFGCSQSYVNQICQRVQTLLARHFKE